MAMFHVPQDCRESGIENEDGRQVRRLGEMNSPRYPKLVTESGQFDARKARQFLYEWCRDNGVLNQSMNLATHLGLSSEETYLLAACNLLASQEHFSRLI